MPVPASSRTGGVSLAAGMTLTADQAGGSPQACTAYAYAAIEGRTVATAAPAACEGLTGSQVNLAAGTAIDRALATGERRESPAPAGRRAPTRRGCGR